MDVLASDGIPSLGDGWLSIGDQGAKGAAGSISVSQ